MLVVVEKAIYQAQSLKQSYSQTKTKTSYLLSPNRDPCVTILVLQFKCCTCMLYSSSQVGMDAGL